MNTTQRGITALLKSAVTGEVLPLPEDFSLREAYPGLKCHHMDALLYEGAVRCGIPRQEETMQQLFRSYCRALLRSEGQMDAFHKICRAFEENGIDYMPLKGCKLKALYPKPELRTMGDADILIRMEQYDRIKPIVETLGFTADVESDHELIWRSQQLFLELHKRLIPSYNEDFYAYFGDGWQLAGHKDGCRYSMTPEDELIYLFTHFAKHFRDGGIGCRYVLDLWVFLRANPGLDAAYLKAELKKLQLWEFYCNIRRLMAVWFEGEETDEKTDFITEFIFSSGSWGQAESHVLSQMVRQSKRSALRFSSKLMYLGGNLFPRAEQLKRKYTILEKAPWTLPLVWLYRPVYKVLFERKDVVRKRNTLQTITNDGVDAKQEMLSYVGLDYNF